MPLMIERFCSGGLPRPRFSGSIGSKSFKTRHSASVKSPRLKPASKAVLNQGKCATSIANPCGNHLARARFRASMVTWKC